MKKSPENEKTELIVVTQLPVIEDQLQAVKATIEKRVKAACSLVCTDETYKEIKKIRSDLNKEYLELEKRRKEIKSQILAPYEQFETVYRECAGDLYKNADIQLGEKIREVENGLKAEKESDLSRFFDEYRESVGIPADFVKLAAAGIKVGLSDSRVSLHRQASEFLDRISSDLKVIDTLEHRDEVFTEYRQTYNLSGAMLTVDNRYKLIEAERKRREEAEARRREQEAAIQAVAAVVKDETPPAVAAPVKSPEKAPEIDAETPKMFKAVFTVYGTIESLKALKNYLNEGGYKYEC